MTSSAEFHIAARFTTRTNEEKVHTTVSKGEVTPNKWLYIASATGDWRDTKGIRGAMLVDSSDTMQYRIIDRRIPKPTKEDRDRPRRVHAMLAYTAFRDIANTSAIVTTSLRHDEPPYVHDIYNHDNDPKVWNETIHTEQLRVLSALAHHLSGDSSRILTETNTHDDRTYRFKETA